MTTYWKIFCAALLSSAAIAMAGCSGRNPNQPAPVVTATAGAVQAVSPASPAASADPQQITVSGIDFSAATTLVLRAPDGNPTLYQSSTFANLSSTTFMVTVTLATPGNWAASVRGPDGVDSPKLAFTVTDPSTALAPQITSITPSTASLSLGSQTVTVNGTNFDAGATLTVRSPSGATTTYATASLTGLSPTSFSVLITYSEKGTYDLVVTNGSGLQSSPAQLLVQ